MIQQSANRTAPPFELIASGAVMRNVVAEANQVCASMLPVLIQGERGVGKKLLASWIHHRGCQPPGRLVHVPCAGLANVPPSPEFLDWPRHLCAEGLPDDASGNFGELSRAGRGTMLLLLEDVDLLPTWAQRGLSAVVSESWLPISFSSSAGACDVRVIATASPHLADAVNRGEFDRALYDHLSLMSIAVPPLRERREDIRPLAIRFLEQYSLKLSRDAGTLRRSISEAQWERMQRFDWPGNVTELAAVMARFAVSRDPAVIDRTLQDSLKTARPNPSETVSIPLLGDLKAMECFMIREVVKRHGGNKAAAARALGMHRRTLYRVLDGAKRDSPRKNEHAGRAVAQTSHAASSVGCG